MVRARVNGSNKRLYRVKARALGLQLVLTRQNIDLVELRPGKLTGRAMWTKVCAKCTWVENLLSEVNLDLDLGMVR